MTRRSGSRARRRGSHATVHRVAPRAHDMASAAGSPRSKRGARAIAKDLHADAVWLIPLQWPFAKTFWRICVGRVLENVRAMAEGDQPQHHA